jgi:hypothetical protein
LVEPLQMQFSVRRIALETIHFLGIIFVLGKMVADAAVLVPRYYLLERIIGIKQRGNFLMKRIKSIINTIRVRRDTKRRNEVLTLLVSHFKSPTKAQLWMKSRIPLLGGLTPEFMISIGRSDRLLKFVKNCIAENKP